MINHPEHGLDGGDEGVCDWRFGSWELGDFCQNPSSEQTSNL